MDLQAAWVKVKVTVASFRKKKNPNKQTKKTHKKKNFVIALPAFINGFSYVFTHLWGW